MVNKERILFFIVALCMHASLYTMESPEVAALQQKLQQNDNEIASQRKRYKKALAQATVNGNRKFAILPLGIGITFSLATIGAYLEMKEHRCTLLPVLSLGTVAAACLGYGVNHFFSALQKKDDIYYASSLFTRIKNRLF